MADYEQIKILRQGVDAWKKWRDQNSATKINLINATLREVDLREDNLRDADLSGANLRKADLRDTDLGGADLRDADLSGANLSGANLTGANLSDATLRGADLHETILWKADLRKCNLRKANLRNTNLHGVNFSEADLWGADLTSAAIGEAIFIHVNLSETSGLKTARHTSSSAIDTDTLKFSKGKIPNKFLHGCGLSDWEIESAKLHNPDLSNEEIVKIQYLIYELRATQAIQISPLFISYSHADTAFVDNLEKGLNEKGVRFWRDIHNATAGRLETQIDRAIRQNPTVLLILSKNSMNSDWVQHEVRKARELEKELGRDALCPIALDDGWKSSRWPQRVMEQVMEYNILDFSKWEDEATFNAKFAKLLSGLDLFYKKLEA